MVSDTKGDEEARDDLRVGIGSVQKRVHVVAGFVGSDNKPPTSAPRDRTQLYITRSGAFLRLIVGLSWTSK